uniref:Glycosyltransferase GT-D fold domain-containing protein n=1 Tax=viral metagenome TaxID=1070528 RepID=A0A6C0KKU7_9ZZZZ
MNLSGNMNEHLQQIIEKINRGEHFGVIRPSDGEYLIIENNTFTNCDGWTNNANGVLREQLINSIKVRKPNLYIGIPCNTCGHSPSNIYNDYIGKYQVPVEQLTYANVFCNSNWLNFIQFLHSYNKGFYLITTGTLPCSFPIKDRLFINKFLVNDWNTVWLAETTRIAEYIKDKQNELICFAAGPLSKMWIPICMELNPNNIYLDIGSTLDIFTKGQENARPYTNPQSHYSREICNFKNSL